MKSMTPAEFFQLAGLLIGFTLLTLAVLMVPIAIIVAAFRYVFSGHL